MATSKDINPKKEVPMNVVPQHKRMAAGEVVDGKTSPPEPKETSAIAKNNQ